MKQFKNFNAVPGLEEIESVNNKVSLNIDQAKLIAGAFGNDSFTAGVDELTFEENQLQIIDSALGAIANAKKLQTTAENELATMTGSINAIDETVANAVTAGDKTNAIKTLLAARPGTTPANTKDGEELDINDEVDWETINNLPHNKMAANL